MTKNIKDVIREGLRKERRVDLVTGEGVNIQNRRREAIEKDPKAVSRDVQQRMYEYRTGSVKKGNVIDKVKRYKNPDNK